MSALAMWDPAWALQGLCCLHMGSEHGLRMDLVSSETVVLWTPHGAHWTGLVRAMVAFMLTQTNTG